MSEVAKAVEEHPVAPVEPTPALEPAAETKSEEVTSPEAGETAAPEAAKDDVEPAAATETPAAPVKTAAAKKEFAGEGFLGYKAPGGFIKKLAGFQKKWFWFGDEPIDSKNLSSYLRGEKPEFANHNAAWSSHTGKGLLYFSKYTSDKPTPAGIINLAEISEIVKDGTSEISFQLYAAKHVFQASTPTERDSWFAALEIKSTEAKELADEVKGSNAYKEHYSSLSKPAVVAAPIVAAAAVKDGEAKKEDKTEAKEEKKEDKSRKSRSASRKRNSIFANFSLGSKKEELAEDKKAEVKEPTAAKEVTTGEAATAEAEVPASAPVDGSSVTPAAVEASVVDEAAKTETPATAPIEPAKPTIANKRNSSIFGTISSKFGPKRSVSERKPSGEVVPEAPAKEASAVEPVSAEAPVIPAPEVSEPLASSVETPATATAPATEQPKALAETEEPKAESKTEAAQKRKSSLPFGLGSPKEKAADVDGDKQEKQLSPFAKFRQTIKSKTSPKAAEKASEKAAEPVEEKTVEPAAETAATTSSEPAATTTEPVISEPISAAHQPNTEVSATA